MANDSLLPPNTSRLERKLEQTARFDLPVPLRELWSIEECPEHLLPWLGWSLGVDFWHLADTPRKRRDLIKNAIAWHKKRGTPWAIKQALATLGYQVEELIEQGEYRQRWLAAGGRVLDGSWQLDSQHTLRWGVHLPDWGSLSRLSAGHWAEYAIRLSISEGWPRHDQAAVYAIAKRYAPARSHLMAVIGGWQAKLFNRVHYRNLDYCVRLLFNRCQGVSVHQRPTLSGCWTLAGDTNWAAEQLQLRTTVKIRSVQHMGGTYKDSYLTGPVRMLNAKTNLEGGLLTNLPRLLDGWPLVRQIVPHIAHSVRLNLRYIGDPK